MEVVKVRKKPTVIEAVQVPLYEGTTHYAQEINQIRQWCGEGNTEPDWEKDGVVLVWNIKEKVWLPCSPGAWIAKGLHGELYPIAGDLFWQLHEAVGE